jgi:hypothetical protein
MIKFLSRKFLMPLVFYLLTGTTKNILNIDEPTIYVFAGLSAFYILCETLIDLKQKSGR